MPVPFPVPISLPGPGPGCPGPSDPGALHGSSETDKNLQNRHLFHLAAAVTAAQKPLSLTPLPKAAGHRCPFARRASQGAGSVRETHGFAAGSLLDKIGTSSEVGTSESVLNRNTGIIAHLLELGTGIVKGGSSRVCPVVCSIFIKESKPLRLLEGIFSLWSSSSATVHQSK